LLELNPALLPDQPSKERDRNIAGPLENVAVRRSAGDYELRHYEEGYGWPVFCLASREELKDIPKLDYISPRSVGGEISQSEQLLAALNPGQSFDLAGDNIVAERWTLHVCDDAADGH
jgi:hypothetical protein